MQEKKSVEPKASRTFEERLREQAETALDVTEQILAGQEVDPGPAKIAMAMISGQIKQGGVANRGVTNVISLVKLGVRDAETRERITIAALRKLLPVGTLPAVSETAALKEA